VMQSLDLGDLSSVDTDESESSMCLAEEPQNSPMCFFACTHLHRDYVLWWITFN